MHGRYHLTFESGKTRASEKAACKEINQVRLKHRAYSLSAGVNHWLFLVPDQVNNKYLMTTTCKDRRI
jgi:hypothetical protein